MNCTGLLPSVSNRLPRGLLLALNRSNRPANHSRLFVMRYIRRGYPNGPKYATSDLDAKSLLSRSCLKDGSRLPARLVPPSQESWEQGDTRTRLGPGTQGQAEIGRASCRERGEKRT